ncbi:MAG: 2-C-methyl-D-erythritol 4-phosphate cytidylyltransferase [Candidatus Nanopelagicales bacterium]|jgi:2-C-methyl-D-erythritol 4-phosphate cytidylyltransferase|nr:2-C-methyl-D-erythritol 4-phosphate cytidylyltransferase [Candidatus Nanopelagicales bacterium]MDP4714294.1 2-C-methyl-D-erythritol 4-phosphate cytidylyltransferase [Candidatus Nanopelagicales bacterium]MDP4907641.1 2-C-methyl-D-erythritol 4-phosphate cytidylyltransferase [Candidatus Nanopelagicales bacterium]MDP4974742.1 2-C-methyl-D-erythritol 4-phosphate cytidylyltransferase [Candidatus Nanopelagicales bacterium]MDP5095856.1 2-C-methyl-D-erythritol 4-phosphate cytidylyltransferase [Candid
MGHNAPRTAIIVPAAGRGERLGPGAPKALRTLAGQPILVHAVRNLATARCVDLIVVAAPEDTVEEIRALLGDIDTQLVIVTGGQTRQDSVARALLALPPDVDVVLVHDAARPLVPSDVVDRVATAVRSGSDAVIPTLGVVDTIKEVDAEGVVRTTLDRSRLHAVQTPQGFARAVLQRAHADSDGEDATDDAGLVERMGVTVTVVPGDEEAFKITRPLDLVLAEAILVRRRAAGGVG